MFDHRKLLNYIRFIPTGDNAQPFRFKIEDDIVHVFHLHSIAQHKFNQFNVASYLSLGMIVQVMKLFASANNLKCDFSFPDTFPENGLWLSCHFNVTQDFLENKKEVLNRLEAISHRYTDRGPYKRGQLNLDKYKLKYDGMISFKGALSNTSYRIVQRLENMIYDDLEAFRNIEKWIKYTSKENSNSQDGMSRKNVGLDFFSALLFKKYRDASFLNLLLRPFFKLMTKLKVRFIYSASSGFGLCYLNGRSDKDIISMGEKIMDMWLELTVDGFTLQPISSCTLLPFIYRNRKGNFNKEYIDDLSDANTILNKEFGIEGEVIWLFRYGPATTSQIDNRTQRLSVADILYKRESDKSNN